MATTRFTGRRLLVLLRAVSNLPVLWGLPIWQTRYKSYLGEQKKPLVDRNWWSLLKYGALALLLVTTAFVVLTALQYSPMPPR